MVDKCKDHFEGWKSRDILTFMKKSMTSKDEILEALFFQLLKDSKESKEPFQLKYLGDFEDVYNGCIEDTICPIPVAENSIIAENHDAVINYLAKNKHLDKGTGQFPGWDAAISPEPNYLLLLQITLNSNIHDIRFSQAQQVLSDLRKKIIDMQYLDLACLFSKLSIAENTKLVTNPTTNANILGDIKVMHRGLINKDSLDEFCGEKTWKKLGKNKGLHGIGMYILTDNLFQLLS